MKNALKIALIVSLIALMSTVAWGRQRRHHEGDGDMPWRTRTYDRCYGGGCDQDDSYPHRVATQPISSVPEPTAALLFVVGGLLVAHRVRSQRKNTHG